MSLTLGQKIFFLLRLSGCSDTNEIYSQKDTKLEDPKDILDGEYVVGILLIKKPNFI